MTRIVAAALLSGNRFLAARRAYPPHAGEWEFPGGKVEPEESDEAALARELCEELGLTEVRLGPQVGGSWPLAGGHHMNVYWAVSPQVPGVRDAHDELAWLTPDNALSVPWITWDEPIVRHVTEVLHKLGNIRNLDDLSRVEAAQEVSNGTAGGSHV